MSECQKFARANEKKLSKTVVKKTKVRANTEKESKGKGVEKSVPASNSFKSYMDGDCITNKESDQYELKQKYVLDEETGIWTVDKRYCVAVGSYYTTAIGTYIDLKLENGQVIECILADCKANVDTDETNRQNPNGSIVEFVVRTSSLSTLVKRMGDCSYANKQWIGEIQSIIVY